MHLYLYIYIYIYIYICMYVCCSHAHAFSINTLPISIFRCSIPHVCLLHRWLLQPKQKSFRPRALHSGFGGVKSAVGMLPVAPLPTAGLDYSYVVMGYKIEFLKSASTFRHVPFWSSFWLFIRPAVKSDPFESVPFFTEILLPKI